MKWYNWINEGLSGIGIVIGLDIVNAKEFLGLILVILNIIVLVISVALKLIVWFKKAKEDGKITKEEVEEAIDIIDDATKNLKNKDKE